MQLKNIKLIFSNTAVKTLDIKNKLDEANKLLELCKQYNTLFIINDDINLCQKVGADGIHIGQGDINARLARESLGKKLHHWCYLS